MSGKKSEVKNPGLLIPNPSRTLEMKQFPTLYKRTSTGKIEFWEINTSENIITTKYGQVDGKVQVTNDIILEGKNIGQSNETTAVQQATKEAGALWVKKKKKGYVESIEDAKAGLVDAEIIKGGVVVMLAHKIRDHARKVQYPCFGQPKLDGTRLTAVIKDGLATLWTRTQKPVTSLPHIVTELEAIFSNAKYLVFDGEAYSDSMNNDFEKLISLVRPEEGVPGHEQIDYHIYDLVNDKTFEERHSAINTFFRRLDKGSPIKIVQTIEINSEDELYEHFFRYKTLGYKGLMVRNKHGYYKHGRSYDLLEVKEAKGQRAPMEDEFKILGVKPGRGKMADKAIFICDNKHGGTFDCKMEGPLENLTKYLRNEKLWKGMVLTVKFQNLTKDLMPRFCIGVRIRPADLSY